MERLKQKETWIFIALALAALALGLTFYGPKARAADKGGPRAPAVEAPASSGWTGISLDVHGALIDGMASAGGPLNLGSTGQMAGVAIAYNHRLGSSPIVLGADVGYDWMFGNLNTLGFNDAITVGGRVGVLATYKTLIYTRAEWIRAQASGGNSTDGWGLGAGIEVKLADTPLSLSLEWMHDWFDHQVAGPSVDIAADRVMARLRLNFDSDVTKLVR